MGAPLVRYILDNREMIRSMYLSGMGVWSIVRELGLVPRKRDYVYYLLCLEGLRSCGKISREILDDVAELRRSGKSVREIADALGVNVSAVRLALYMLGMGDEDIKARMVEKAKELYLSGVNMKTLSRIFGVSPQTVAKWLEKGGVRPRRGRGRPPVRDKRPLAMDRIADEIRAKVMERGIYTRDDMRREYPKYATLGSSITSKIADGREIYLARLVYRSTSTYTAIPKEYSRTWILYRKEYEDKAAEIIASMIGDIPPGALRSLLRRNQIPESLAEKIIERKTPRKRRKPIA